MSAEKRARRLARARERQEARERREFQMTCKRIKSNATKRRDRQNRRNRAHTGPHRDLNKAYSQARAAHLAEHPFCQINAPFTDEEKARGMRCDVQATQIHHTKGRQGENLLLHFLSACHSCHTWVHNNRERALELGFLKED